MDKTMADTITVVAETIGTAGKASLIFVVLMNMVYQYSINNLLSIVRSLSLITHMMLM